MLSKAENEYLCRVGKYAGPHDTVVLISHRMCNWMQGWEGEMDTIHQAFLHACELLPAIYLPLTNRRIG